MDHDLLKFPMLSFVLHHADPTSHEPPSPATHQALSSRFSHLTDPHVMSTLIASLPTTITQTLFVLQSAGPRPDPAAVSAARSKIAQIRLNPSLSGGKTAEEVEMCDLVVKLEEIHEGYEKQLMELEEDLIRVYDSAVEDLSDDKMNEDVVAVLKQVEDGVAVERIDLSDRKLKLLPEAFGKIRGLVSLNLSQNDLKFIPDAISGLHQLEELNVSSNILKSLPDSIGLLLNLRVLNVSGNKLTALPDSIAQCRSLVELDASFNNLASLPTNVGFGLINLETLMIQLNKIRYLPASICEMRSLRYLDAHMNEIHGLPQEIGRLTNLEVMNLSSNFNDLIELPDTISDLANLRELDLSNNQIRVLPDSFFMLEKLLNLNLDENPLEIPPREVASKGAEGVREFMRRRWAEIIEEEQQRSIDDINRQQGGATGWLSWGASMISNVVSNVTETIGGHGETKNPRDSYLDQPL